ncbi:MAG: hypothetical protein J6U64_05180, partial [Alphaproteobacteria bacterium]|nr:hypothetical protein [Alphaproteobacteria bacterium]
YGDLYNLEATPAESTSYRLAKHDVKRYPDIIMAGDKETGITIMQMDAGLDTGDILLMESTPITENMTGGELHDKL